MNDMHFKLLLFLVITKVTPFVIGILRGSFASPAPVFGYPGRLN